MSFSLENFIYPMSDLRSDPEKIKKQLKKSPVLITNKGRPDFGICDLDTLTIATQISRLKTLLAKRKAKEKDSIDIEDAFKKLDEKYCF